MSHLCGHWFRPKRCTLRACLRAESDVGVQAVCPWRQSHMRGGPRCAVPSSLVARCNNANAGAWHRLVAPLFVSWHRASGVRENEGLDSLPEANCAALRECLLDSCQDRELLGPQPRPLFDLVSRCGCLFFIRQQGCGDCSFFSCASGNCLRRPSRSYNGPTERSDTRQLKLDRLRQSFFVECTVVRLIWATLLKSAEANLAATHLLG